MTDVVRRLTISGRTEGLDQVEDAITRVTQALGGMSQASARMTDPTRAYEGLQQRLDPARRAFQQFYRDIDVATRQFQKAGSDGLSAYIRDVDRVKAKLAGLGTSFSQGPSVDPNQLLGRKAPGARGAAQESALVFEAESNRLQRFSNEMLQKVDPIGEAQKRYAASVRDATAAEREGILTTAQRIKIIEHAQTTLDNVSRDHSGKLGFSMSQKAQLGYQLNDVVSGLAMGQSPMTIATQQGGQIYQALADTPGGAAQGVKDLAASFVGLGRFITPVTVGLTGAATAATLGAVAYFRFRDAIQASERALNGLGRGSGATVGGINAAASQAAGPGSGLSLSQAREAGNAFAATGRIGQEMYADLTKSARDYAYTTGQEVPDAIKELAGAFADPAKGAELLRDRIGGLTSKQVDLIQSLARSGDRVSAQNVLLTEYQKNVTRHTQQLSAWAAAEEAVSRGADTILNKIGALAAQAAGTDPVEDQLKRSQAALARLRNAPTLGGMFDWTKQIAEVEQRIAGLQQRVDARAKASAAEQARQRGDLLAAAVRGISPEIGDREGLGERFDLLNRGQNDNAARGTLNPKVAQEYATALDKARQARDTYLTSDQQARQSDDLSLRTIQARTAGEYALLAAEEKRLSMAGQAITTEERRRREMAASVAVLAQYRKESEDLARTANDNLKGAGQLPFQQRLVQQAQTDFETRRRFAGADPQTRANAEQALAAQRRAISIEALTPIRDANMAITEQVANLKVQRDGFLASTEAAAAMAAKQDLINQFARQGIDIMKSNAEAVEAYAKRAGEAAKANENFQRTSQNIVAGMDEIRSSTQSTFTGIFSDLRQGKNPLQGILTNLGRQSDQLVDRLISKPLTESLLGFAGKGGGGAIGDATSKMFGDVSKIALPQTISTPLATINASSVIVGGAGIGGVGGAAGLGGAANANTVAQGAGGSVVSAATSAVGRGAVSVRLGGTAPDGTPITQASLPNPGTETLRVGGSEPFSPFSVVRPAQDSAFRLPDLPRVGSEPSAFYDIVGKRDRAFGDILNPSEMASSNRALQDEVFGFKDAAQTASTSLSQVGDAGSSAASGLGSIVNSLGSGGGQGMPGLGGLFGGSAGSSSGTPSFDGGDWFANGGIMTSRGRLPLNKYASGGIANSPQVAIFGEGRMNEAFVPLPDGNRIPVSMNVPLPANTNAGAMSAPVLNHNDSRTINITPAGGVTTEEMRSALAQYDRESQRTLVGRLRDAERRRA